MARPSDEALVAIELIFSRPDYITLANFEYELRELVDLISLLEPPEPDDPPLHEAVVEFPEPGFVRERAVPDYSDDEDLQGIDPGIVSQVLNSRTAQGQRPRPREPRPPTVRQQLARKRRTNQYQVEIAELRYGSDVQITLQTAAYGIAAVLMFLPFLYMVMSNAWAGSRENRSGRRMLEARDLATQVMI